MLFLGTRCLQPHEVGWTHENYEVLPSPWIDRARFDRAASYLDSCGEAVLARLADYLNTVHRQSFSRRYWRIVAGNWLLNYLHATYDRFVQLQDALAKYPDLRTLVLDPACFRVPADTREMASTLKNADRANLQLFSVLLTAMGHTFESRRTAEGSGAQLPSAGRPPAVTGRAVRAMQRRVLSALAARADAVLSNTDTMTRAAAWRLAAASGFRIVPTGPSASASPAAAVFDRRRLQLNALAADDAFQRAAVHGLPYFLPTALLEGYEGTRRRALAGWRQMPRVIVSTTGWSFDEGFKVFAAEAAEQGSRLVAVQHGGGYGVARQWPSEGFERRLSDTFATWGWEDASGGRVRRLPHPRLSQVCATGRRPADQRAGVLFVTTGNKRYVTRFNSSPLGTLDDEYFDGHARFLGALTPDIRRIVRFRPPAGTAHPRRQSLSQRFSEVAWNEAGTLHQALSSARLVVVDHPVTSMLEVLATGTPTILFWDPDRWEMRPEAMPYFDALRAAGVLHDSAAAAATAVNDVLGDLERWWQEPSRQQARQACAQRFALVASDWQTAWLQGISAEVAEAHTWI